MSSKGVQFWIEHYRHKLAERAATETLKASGASLMLTEQDREALRRAGIDAEEFQATRGAKTFAEYKRRKAELRGAA